MFERNNKMDTQNSNYFVLYNNEIVFGQNFGGSINDFTSPIIPHIHLPRSYEFRWSAPSIYNSDSNQKSIEKTHWLCDYSDDIFQTLREAELGRRLICFRSQQVCERPKLLQLLKNAAENHKLSRTTLHLAIYFLDCFMDNYTIGMEKLNLSAIACLLIAAKLEETDVNMPKFSDLNKVFNENYTLKDFKSVECKVLLTFKFDLIRPTVATFAEYFANSIITLQDYHIFLNHWNNEIIQNNYHQQQEELQTRANDRDEINTSSFIVLSTPCPYISYDNMLTTLSKIFFELVDISLSYLKFANARPSVIASACIAAVRQIHGVFPIWTPYLIKQTHCTVDVISPFVEAILAIYRVHYNSENKNNLKTVPSTPLSSTGNITVLCESPDSGVVSGNDTKSTISDTDEDECLEILNMDANNISDVPDDSDEEEDCLEYPMQPKRRRIF